MKPFVIGFMGYAGVGKTTVANIFQSLSPLKIGITSFARPLKQAVKDLFLFSDDQMYGDLEIKNKIDERWGKSPRQCLQIIGTDCLRNMIDLQFHVKRMDAYLKESTNKIIIIDDIRFDGEAELVNNYGVCFKIERPGFPQETIRHASEYPPLHKASSYYVLNNQDSVYSLSARLLSNNSYIKNLIMEKLAQ